jgi:amidase
VSSSSSEIVDLDAVTLASQIRSRAVSCREVMLAHLAQADAWNPVVNAIVARPDPDALLAQADARDAELASGVYHGVLHGFPQAPKDLAATVGLPTTMGSPIFRDQFTPHDAVFVERMRAAGSIFVGRTNTPEFGLGSHTYNNVNGATRNPWDPTRTAGGSSGGAAVAVATRMLPLADGSDMMGSLRNPGAFNNVFGLRPTRGLVPQGPGRDIFFQQLSTDGPMARTVPDLAMLLGVMAGAHPRLPLSQHCTPADFSHDLARDFKGVRVGWLGDLDGYLATEPGVLDLCRAALKGFEDIGCEVALATLPMPPAELWDMWLTLRAFLVSGELSVHYADPARRALLKPEAIWEVERGLALQASAVYAASVARTAWYRSLHAMFEQFDYLVLPSAQVFPFPVEQHWPTHVGGREMDTYHRWMEVVIPATLAGVPALNVPAGFNAGGLPMGLQIIGPAQADFAVLQLGHAYDQATGWSRKQPARR